MDEVTSPQGFGRFTKHIILGSVFGGVLSAIPVLNCINCLFCILNMAGVVFALRMYLNANPNDMLTTAETVSFGAAAGAGAGLIYGILNMLISLVAGTAIAALLASIPGADKAGALTSVGVSGMMSVLFIPLNMIIYGVFGALGAFLGMQFLFKARLRKA